MSDISSQLIKDSYNYVLQSDLSTGIVYRIGGGIPVNPKFLSGLTINSNFNYSNGTEQPGFVLITDASGNATWGPVSGSSSGNYLSLSGGTVTGPTIFTGGLTANTISATTYQNLPVSGITGGTGISAGTTNGLVTIVNTLPDQVVTITGGTNININGTYPNFGINFTGSTGVSGNFLPLSGGTVTGATNFTGGLTANTISATTYQNLPVSGVTGGTGISANTTNGLVTIVNTAPDQIVTLSGGTGISTGGTYPNFVLTNTAPDQVVTITGGTNIGINGVYPNFGINFTGSTGASGDFLPLSGGTVTGETIFTSGLTANTISATTYQNLPVSGVTGGTGISASTSDGLVTIVNISPDQIVTLSGGTGISTGGTYPNFVLTNTAPDQIVTITGGTNIGINGTYPNFGINFTGSTGASGDFLPLSGGTVTGATIFTGGLTANTISATTYQNLPQDIFVTGGTYTSGNAIFTNNSGGTFTVSGFPIGSGGGQIFYLNLSQSQNGNRLLSTTGSTASEQSTGVTINNGVTGTISSFQSQPLNTTLLPGGIWSFYLHSYKENTNASFNIFVEVYKRTSGGTETLLFATDPTPVTTNSPNPSMQLSDGYFSGTSLSVSDGVVAVVRATNTDNQPHIITLVTEGSTHYSYVVSTIPTQQGLTCDTLSGCSIIQTIQTDVSNKFDKSGGTITGNLIINSGLTANTISATTYYNLPNTSFTGGTVTGATSFTGGLTANTISATTITSPSISPYGLIVATSIGYQNIF